MSQELKEGAEHRVVFDEGPMEVEILLRYMYPRYSRKPYGKSLLFSMCCFILLKPQVTLEKPV